MSRTIYTSVAFLVLLSFGCSTPAILSPKKTFTVPGKEAVMGLFASTKETPPPKKLPTKNPKVFDDDFDFSQLKENPQFTQPIQAKQVAQVSANVPVEPIPAAPPTETDIRYTKYLDTLSKDKWAANLELRAWLDKQAETGQSVSVKSLVASPDNGEMDRKTNFYDELNQAAGSKISRGNYTYRDSDLAALGPISLNRWYNDAIEKAILNSETDEILDLTGRVLAESQPKSIASTNAAIILARLGVEETKPFLIESILNRNISVPQRCAAAEALASLKSTQNDELVKLLLSHSEKIADSSDGNRQGQFSPGTPDLVGELLQSLADRIIPTEDPCFTLALRSRIPAIRLVAVKIWRDNFPLDAESSQVCPDELSKLIVDPSDERIRAAALIAIVRWNHPNVSRYLRDGMDDTKLPVRLAAIDAMGILGGDDSITMLQKHTLDTSAKVRAKTASTLRKLGANDELFALVDDKSSEVRAEIAKGLTDPGEVQTRELAKKMLDDQSAIVQKFVIESIGEWPVEIAAPILLKQMESQSLIKRETATVALAKSWPDAAKFDFADRRIELRAAALEQLKEEFNESEIAKNINENFAENGYSSEIANAKYGLNPRELDIETLNKGRNAILVLTDPETNRFDRKEAEEELLEIDKQLVLVVEYMVHNENRLIPQVVYRNILPQIDPIFKNLLELERGSVSVRRLAANEILAEAKMYPLGPLPANRLYEIGIEESDTLALITLMQIFELCPGEIADNFAAFHLENSAPEIRRRASVLLGKSDDYYVVEELFSVLNDSSPEIVLTTIESIGLLSVPFFEDLENLSSSAQSRKQELESAQQFIASVSDSVRMSLLRPESSIQIAAAVTLTRWKDPEGISALQRLASANEYKTRLMVAQSLSRLHEPKLGKILVHLLDDENGSVRNAALNSLPKLYEKDYGNPHGDLSLPNSEKIQNWKNLIGRR